MSVNTAMINGDNRKPPQIMQHINSTNDLMLNKTPN